MHLEKIEIVKNKIIHFKMKKGFGKANTCLGHRNTPALAMETPASST
jgi:hypothetical protein